MTNSESWVGKWTRFRDQYQERVTRFAADIQGAWQGLSSDLDRASQAIESINSNRLDQDQLSALDRVFSENAGTLLVELVKRRLDAEQLQRVLNVITEFSHSSNALVRSLPNQITVSGRELRAVVAPGSADFWLRSSARLKWMPRSLRLRQVIVSHLARERYLRARLDGEFQALLAEASLAILGPWRAFRGQCLERLGSLDGESSQVKLEHIWRRKASRLSRRAEGILGRYSSWCNSAVSRLNDALLLREEAAPPSRHAVLEQKYLRFWWRQQRAVRGALELELELGRAARHMVDVAEESLAALDAEHQKIRQKLEAITHWLDASGGANAAQFPALRLRPRPAQARADECIRKMAAFGEAELPAALETVDPGSPLPGWRKPWRKVEPDTVFLRAVHGVGRRMILEGFQEAEAVHNTIIGEMARSRDVITYAKELEEEREEGSAQVAQEAVSNATELLRSRAQSTQEVRPAAEAVLTRGTASSLLECYIALDQGRIGLLAHLAEEAGERGAQRVWQLGIQGSRTAALHSWRQVRRLSNQALYGLGLKTPPVPLERAVIRSMRLQDLPEFQAAHPVLPLIYDKLFHLNPIDEPRFLAGQQDQMEGLAECALTWKSGGAVSVLVVGSRGSGKTSLLNCAEQEVFSGMRLFRREFQQRILTEEALLRSLGDLLEVPPENLADSLSAQRQVIVLEGVQRTFLRRMNGFEAVRSLLELISNTWRSTLWVLAINARAFRLLDRVANMGQFFSHRINLGAVSQKQLEEAIMVRHNLSGYRHSFAPPLANDPRVNRLRRRLGVEPEAHEVFFENLHEQSQGIYLSAIDLWRRHVEKVEGGVVHLRQPVEGSYKALVSSLSAQDLYTLHAVVQHGGLTIEHLGEVFSEAAASSRSRLERLLALDLLEEDPNTGEFRVRTAASRVVRDALHRHNL